MSMRLNKCTFSLYKQTTFKCMKMKNKEKGDGKVVEKLNKMTQEQAR